MIQTPKRLLNLLIIFTVDHIVTAAVMILVVVATADMDVGPMARCACVKPGTCLVQMFKRLGAKEFLPQSKAATDLYSQMCMCQTRNLSGADA